VNHLAETTPAPGRLWAPSPAFLESPVKKAVAFTLLGILLLFGVGLVAKRYVFDRGDRVLVDKPGDPPPAPGEMSWNTYKKTKLALESFDLANGLTKHELENIHISTSLSFYYLLACLWLAFGLRLSRRTHKKPHPGDIRW
jgi:hypothetical protein